MRLVLLGPPGSGKGTQGQRLSISLQIPHIATGDMIRDHIARKTEFGLKVEAGIASGNFAPDDDMLAMICDRLLLADAQNGFILDGFPRDLAQAQAYEVNDCTAEKTIDAVIELRLTQAVLVERLSGRLVCPVCDQIYHRRYHPPQHAGICDNEGAKLVRRPDDEPKAIKRRFDVYEKMTLPLRAYYEAQGKLLSVEAGGDADATYDLIAAALQVTQNRDI